MGVLICKETQISRSLKEVTWKERLQAINEGKWALLMPVIILGGIYGGIFTPTEAAVVAVIYGFILSLFVYREMKWKEFHESND